MPQSGNLSVLFLLSSQKWTFCSLAEKLWTGSKNSWHLLGWAPCKVWGRLCRCENIVFVTIFCLSRSEARVLFVRGGHSSIKYCVTVAGRFWFGFHRFFRRDQPFRCNTWFLFSSLDGATNSEKWQSKIAKIQKSAEKFVRTTSCR